MNKCSLLIVKFKKYIFDIGRTLSDTNWFRVIHETPNRTWLIALLCVGGFFVLGPSHHSGRAPDHASKGELIPVVGVAESVVQDVPIFAQSIGTITPLESVVIKSQIAGELRSVLFAEGDTVKKGQVLARIDPRPYEAALQQTEGQLLRDQAILENAKIDLKRYEQLFPQESVSQQQLESQCWLVKQYEGAVKIDEGLVAQARVNLDYCTISATVTGRIGLRNVDPGNYVAVTDTSGIATINTFDPISLIFTLPEDTAIELQRDFRGRGHFHVMIFDRSMKQKLGDSHDVAVDNQVDTRSGTIKFRTIVNNGESKFFPHQFVNVKIQKDIIKKALTVPMAALQHGQKGDYVYVYEANKVHVRYLKIGPISDDEVIVLSGLEPAQKVVVEGVENLRDGQNVKVEESQGAKAEEPKSDLGPAQGGVAR